MNYVPFFILIIHICFVSELEGISGGDGSHVGDLIKMKSGKIFLRLSRMEKDTEEESGQQDLPNYDDSKV